ncbi:hypothetical protein P0Y35_13190 [Kiritimatiellaeota bacterium B1221]|nr:hypothetical protein [Kiritimatiellaeota bacterium B1221]
MTKIEKILLPVVMVAAVGMCVLWVNEQQSSKQLAHQLQSAKSELEQVDADRRGLLKANDQLQGRLAQVEKAAAALKSEPRNPQVDEVMAVLDLPPALTEEPRRRGENNQEPTILSPEELAERQKRDEERQQRRAEYQSRVSTELQTRRAFFSQINTEGLSPEYQAAHQDLMQRLVTAELLMNKMSDPELSRDERRELGRELWGQSREMGELMDMQRDVLLNDYAELSLGLSADKTREFMEYMETVNQMTSGSPMRGGGGRRGR